MATTTTGCVMADRIFRASWLVTRCPSVLPMRHKGSGMWISGAMSLKKNWRAGAGASKNTASNGTLQEDKLVAPLFICAWFWEITGDKARSFKERKYIQQWVYWCYRHQGSQTTVFNTSWKPVMYSQENAVMSLKSMPQVLRKQLLGSYCAYLPPIHNLYSLQLSY